ncbi:hypothetical protein OHA21_43600 [Actinoplanes sp. NBC_00393]|uniref:hypothetical protein n=1 Tax=Actinoplanes sp. NBC_00393 TaxID=2975953 RepID=UPI002E214AC6
MSDPTTDANEERRAPAEPRLIHLSLDSLLASLRGSTTEQDPQPSPPRTRAARFSFAIVSGYVVGVAGFYTNFFDTLLQATAGLVDVLGMIFLVWLAVNHWHRNTPPSRRIPNPIALSLAAVCLFVMGGLTVAAAHPPGRPPLGTNETCSYDVSAGFPIPLRPEGLIKETLSLDEEPSEVVVEVLNKSPDDQIGVYVKAPDEADVIPEALSGVTIRGHAGQAASYRRPDWTLSGCIAA